MTVGGYGKAGGGCALSGKLGASRPMATAETEGEVPGEERREGGF